MGGWFRKEINTRRRPPGPQDSASAALPARSCSKLGVIPQQPAGGEIYDALEKGTIDAAEFVGPYDDEKLGFVKVAPYYYYPGWWEGGPTVHAMFNKAKFEALPPAYQSLLKTAVPGGRTSTCWPSTTSSTPPRSSSWSPRARKLRPFSPEILEAVLQGGRRDLRRDRAPTSPTSRRSGTRSRRSARTTTCGRRSRSYTFDAFMMSQQRAGDAVGSSAWRAAVRRARACGPGALLRAAASSLDSFGGRRSCGVRSVAGVASRFEVRRRVESKAGRGRSPFWPAGRMIWMVLRSTCGAWSRKAVTSSGKAISEPHQDQLQHHPGDGAPDRCREVLTCSRGTMPRR